jgi:molybdenum cofactor cytidylyltransferase
MSHAPSFCGVILAAGESSRMGTDKALLAWPPPRPGTSSNETFLSASIRALSAVTDLVIVVTGKNTSLLEPIVYASGAFLAANPGPERGQFSSLQVGLQDVLNRGRDAAMITLVDRPPVRIETLETLRSAFENAVDEGQWAVIPEYGERHGHPILIGRELIEIFLRAPATANARDLRQANERHVQYVAVEDPFVTMNVDTPQDYETLLSGHSR